MLNIDFFYIYFSAGYLDDPDSNVVFYILLKAVDRFYTQYHRYPGTFDQTISQGLTEILMRHWASDDVAP